jgi:hypothetical protein
MIFSDEYPGWVYLKDDDNRNRFALGEVSQNYNNNNTLICFGVNPSTATPKELDNTLKNVKAISKYNGFDNWIMFNLYPLRETHPKSLPESKDNEVCIRNIEAIKKVIECFDEKTHLNVWFAWGVPIEEKKYLFECFDSIYNEILSNRIIKSHCIGTTKSKQPRHPSRKAHANLFERFDIEDYRTIFC